jgi:hypothetical protein
MYLAYNHSFPYLTGSDIGVLILLILLIKFRILIFVSSRNFFIFPYFAVYFSK